MAQNWVVQLFGLWYIPPQCSNFLKLKLIFSLIQRRLVILLHLSDSGTAFSNWLVCNQTPCLGMSETHM